MLRAARVRRLRGAKRICISSAGLPQMNSLIAKMMGHFRGPDKVIKSCLIQPDVGEGYMPSAAAPDALDREERARLVAQGK
jgi:hypothetical protein